MVKRLKIGIVTGMILFSAGMCQRAIDPFDYSHMPNLDRYEIGWESPVIWTGEFMFLLCGLFFWAAKEVENDIKENRPKRNFWTNEIIKDGRKP